MIVKDEAATIGARANVAALLESTRIGAQFEVLVAQDDPVDLICETSRDADLVILGARPPDGTYEFGPVFERLLERTSSLRAVAYVIAAEDVAFEEILR